MEEDQEQGRDANACNGALYRCTNVAQQPYEIARIFAGHNCQVSVHVAVSAQARPSRTK